MALHESVWDFLSSQLRGRPQLFEEIVRCVDKSRSSCWRELCYLLLMRDVFCLVLRFNGREVIFYSVKDGVDVVLVKGGLLVEVEQDVFFRLE